jgi:hypothetical protein
VTAVSIIVATASLWVEARPRAGEYEPSVLVHVEVLGGAIPETLAGARDELTHLYRPAGIRIDWSAAPAHDQCRRQFSVHVVLVGGDAFDRYRKLVDVSRNVLAEASSDARRIYVFLDRLGPGVDHRAVAHGDALGLVIAHELGHVLLPGRRHSPDSIMQEQFDALRSYGLRFTPDEARAMRAFIDTATPAFADQR